jgi:hypothetical protein
MPDLDVSDAFGPEMMDTFTVIRRVEVMVNGRSTTTETPFKNVEGIVAPSSPDDLQRLPEGDYMNKALTIITPFRLQGPSPNYKADEIEWPVVSGNRYLVRVVDDYSAYGEGFIQAVAASIEAMDPPPMGSA